MSKGQSNSHFLNVVEDSVKTEILSHIATHYGISSTEALEEVIDSEAESLLDYMKNPQRSAISVLMKQHSLRSNK